MPNVTFSSHVPAPDAELVVPIGNPFDLRLVLGIHARGTGDPALRFEASGACWRASRTPEGGVTLLLRHVPDGVHVRAWGRGTGWALGQVPELLGALDDPGALVPHHPAVADAMRRVPGLRLGRSGRALEALVPAILEQKVTGDEARRVYRGLLRRYGEDAPGPAGLRLAPEPAVLAGLPYHAFHPIGLERRRAELVARVCRDAARLEALAPAEAGAALRRYPGIGPWTSAEVRIRAFGDPDAVSVGDFHLPDMVAWALAGEPRGDDARMLELLEPYRGQRGRVVRLLELAGFRAPRYGPRLSPRRIDRL